MSIEIGSKGSSQRIHDSHVSTWCAQLCLILLCASTNSTRNTVGKLALYNSDPLLAWAVLVWVFRRQSTGDSNARRAISTVVSDL